MPRIRSMILAVLFVLVALPARAQDGGPYSPTVSAELKPLVVAMRCYSWRRSAAVSVVWVARNSGKKSRVTGRSKGSQEIS